MNTRDIADLFSSGARFVCAYAYPKAFEYLSIEANLINANRALVAFDREIRQLPDNGAFYVAPTSLENKKDAAQLKKSFEEIRDAVYPIVSFIELSLKSQTTPGALIPGSPISYPTLLNEITSHDHLLDALSKLVRHKQFKNSKSTPDGQLNVVFERLVDIGLLTLKNRSQLIYEVTGMIEYIHTLIQKINDHEQVEFSQDDEQGELIL